MIQAIIAASSAVLLCMMMPVAAQQLRSEADDQRCEALQDRFITARARQDVDAMASVFAQDAVRVTPDGVFQGRDAIRRNLENVVALGLHDFSSQRTVSRREGNLLLNAGTWQATLGDLPLHGYYSALVSCADDRPEILEEATNVAAPSRR